MARLQILELPEGGADERRPFVLIVDQFDSPFLNSSFDQFAKDVGARGIIATTGTIDIPANDTLPSGAQWELTVDGRPAVWARVGETGT